MKPHLITLIGIVLALWMTLGRWLFGIGGTLSIWYVPTIGIAYVWLQWWTARRMTLTHRKGRRTRPRVFVTLILSWANAIAFGLTVPDLSEQGLLSLAGLWGGPVWNEMSIALCNPFGILAFALTIAAIAFAAVDGRDPRPSEDEIDDARRAMMEHPLA